MPRYLCILIIIPMVFLSGCGATNFTSGSLNQMLGGTSQDTSTWYMNRLRTLYSSGQLSKEEFDDNARIGFEEGFISREQMLELINNSSPNSEPLLLNSSNTVRTLTKSNTVKTSGRTTIQSLTNNRNRVPVAEQSQMETIVTTPNKSQSHQGSVNGPYTKKNIECVEIPAQNNKVQCRWWAIQIQSDGTYTQKYIPGAKKTPDNYKRALKPVYKDEEEYWIKKEKRRLLWRNESGSMSEEKIIANERSDSESEAKECKYSLNMIENDLEDFASLLNDEKCGPDNETLITTINELQNAKGTHNRGYWVRYVNKCVNSFNNSTARNIYHFNDLLPDSYRDCGKQGIQLFDDIIITMNDVIGYYSEVIETAERAIASAQNRTYNQKKAQERAHQRRMNDSFRKWANDLQTSNQKTLGNLNRCTRILKMPIKKCGIIISKR